MSPTTRSAVLMAAIAALALIVPVPIAAIALTAIVVATAVDAFAVRHSPPLVRTLDGSLARGVPARVEIKLDAPCPGRPRLRQPLPPTFRAEGMAEGDGASLDLVVTPQRRGRHELPAPVLRLVGPLGLGRWDHTAPGSTEVTVYPDLPAARRLAAATRASRRRGEARRLRGPLGLGTDFELVRDYEPDDDVRQINWRATVRVGRPMSNQYRVDQDREVMCLVDTGRLMAAPLGDRNRLDAALDAVAAVALVADELGDRCGGVAFDATIRRHLPARRHGGRPVIEGLFDLEPQPIDSDYELAFRTVARAKRAFVLLLTDLLDESAASQLLEAVPVLARKHMVAVASVRDPEIAAAVTAEPRAPFDVYAASVATGVLEARSRVAARLRQTGADVVEAPPASFAAACTRSYLDAKARARL